MKYLKRVRRILDSSSCFVAMTSKGGLVNARGWADRFLGISWITSACFPTATLVPYSVITWLIWFPWIFTKGGNLTKVVECFYITPTRNYPCRCSLLKEMWTVHSNSLQSLDCELNSLSLKAYWFQFTYAYDFNSNLHLDEIVGFDLIVYLVRVANVYIASAEFVIPQIDCSSHVS